MDAEYPGFHGRELDIGEAIEIYNRIFILLTGTLVIIIFCFQVPFTFFHINIILGKKTFIYSTCIPSIPEKLLLACVQYGIS